MMKNNQIAKRISNFLSDEKNDWDKKIDLTQIYNLMREKQPDLLYVLKVCLQALSNYYSATQNICRLSMFSLRYSKPQTCINKMIKILNDFNVVIGGGDEQDRCPGDYVEQADDLIRSVKGQRSMDHHEIFLIAKDWMESCKRVNISSAVCN